jgi:serpin B
MRRLPYALTLVAIVTTNACTGGTPSPTPVSLDGIREVRSDVGRAPAGSAEELAAVVATDRDFAFRLYQQLVKSEQGNLFYSPYSISTALSMAYAGANADTAKELAAALAIGGNNDSWHSGRNSLDLALAAPRPAIEGLDSLKLEAANGIFGQQGYPFKDPFLRTLAADYGAGMQTVDYVKAAEQARTLINAWVSNETNDRIKELLAKGSVDELTRLVLVNAIYFKGNWITQFDPKQTKQAPFTRLDGSQVQADMMHAQPETTYAAGDGCQAVRLAYAGNASMLLIVPDTGRFADVESSLTGQQIKEISDSLMTASVSLDLPKWSSASSLDLVPTLKQLGITKAFDPNSADFSGMTTADNLYVSGVVHQANVTVDEHGTEAAAATALILGTVAAPLKVVSLSVDRPFIYLVTDDVTGEVLFVGRVLEPTAD